MQEISIIDSIMGTGKTTWAINFMNRNKDRRFIYCTPYVDEVKRILTECPHFKEPIEDNPSGTKQGSFLELLKGGECIATTHVLFEHICVTDSILSLIKECGYTLILDEVIEVVEKVKATKYDIDDLQKYVHVDEKTKIVTWKTDDYKGDHIALKRLIKTKTVIQYKDNLLLWLFPISLLATFGEIYILTFLFKGSYLEQYLTIHNLGYSMFYIQDGILKDGTQPLETEKKRIRSLLDIYDGRLNSIGDDRTALCARWWRKRRNDDNRCAINRNANNYLRNVLNAKSSEIIWTVFKRDENKKHNPTINGRWGDRYCSCNARATNSWRECTALAYLVNMFHDPSVANWFKENNGCINEEQYALSAMLQWIWRSAIREGKHVHLYIPSRRMREMLIDWLSSSVQKAP